LSQHARTITQILVGCRPGCIHRLPDVAHTEDHTGRQGRYELLVVNEACARAEERSARRAKIYERARRDSDAAWQAAVGRGLRHPNAKAAEAWRHTADEWAREPCPFYQGAADTQS